MQANNWIPIAQAAMQIGKTRQTVEGLIKKKIIESKAMGNKKTIHVNMETLLLHYAKKSAASLGTNYASKSHNLHTDAQSDAKFECKRLTDLLARSERLLEKTENDLRKEREKNEVLQSELVNNMREMQALLRKDSGLMSFIRTFRK